MSLQAAKCKRGMLIPVVSGRANDLELTQIEIWWAWPAEQSISEMHAMSFTFHCIGTESRYASVLNSDRLLALLRDLELSIFFNSAFGSSPYLFAPKLPLKAKLFSLRFNFFSFFFFVSG